MAESETERFRTDSVDEQAEESLKSTRARRRSVQPFAVKNSERWANCVAPARRWCLQRRVWKAGFDRPTGKTENCNYIIIGALDWNRRAVHWHTRYGATATFAPIVTGARSLRIRVRTSALLLSGAATERFRYLGLTAATGPRDNDAAGQGHRHGQQESQNAAKIPVHRIHSVGGC